MRKTMLSIGALTMAFSTIVTPSQTSTTNFDPLGEMQVDLPRMIRVFAEFIEMPHATYTGLMADPRSTTNDTDLRTKCTQLINDGKARMIESMSLTAVPGQSATVESVAEYIYPTEAEPASPPRQVSTKELPFKHLGSNYGYPPTPSAFDTKNTGSTLEVEAHIDNRSPIVELRITPTIVYLSDHLIFSTWKNEKSTVHTSSPLFYVLKTRLGATLRAGEPQMIAAHSPQDDKGMTDFSRKVMLFVRADIIHTGK